MHFDWTVSLSSIIQLVVILAAIFKLVANALKKITKRMVAMERRVDMMWGWIIIQMTKDQRDQYEAWMRNHPATWSEEA